MEPTARCGSVAVTWVRCLARWPGGKEYPDYTPGVLRDTLPHQRFWLWLRRTMRLRGVLAVCSGLAGMLLASLIAAYLGSYIHVSYSSLHA
jgi:hypothetical protein